MRISRLSFAYRFQRDLKGLSQMQLLLIRKSLELISLIWRNAFIFFYLQIHIFIRFI